MTASRWEPPALLTKEAIIASSRSLLQRPDMPTQEREDLFRLRVAELDWDIACKVYEPQSPGVMPRGADGKRIGLFMLHGGEGDHLSLEPLARMLVSKFGYRVVCMSYPGRLNLRDPSRRWPGDTLGVGGTARTPIWLASEEITPDQYELVEDRSDPAKRHKWGTLFFLSAREGTTFHNRMASWPLAFEEGMKAACARHFPALDYSIYMHGHSTGGPFVHMLLQRVPNAVGLLGTETSPFGYIFGQMVGMQWHMPFNYLTIRTWRHIAKYVGTEAGPDAVKRLPMLMEEVFDAWEQAKAKPQFKAEYCITYAALDALAAAARATASRLRLSSGETEALVQRYQGYTRAISAPGAKPVPPLLYGITQGSRDHTPQRYNELVLPALAAITPAPRVRVVQYEAGVHGYAKPEPDLPNGVMPAMIQLWHEAIGSGYYLP